MPVQPSLRHLLEPTPCFSSAHHPPPPASSQPPLFVATLQHQPGKCIPEDWARFYAAEVLSALEYLHMNGVVYRDLKPENILVAADGHLVLADFDLSKVAAPSSKKEKEPKKEEGFFKKLMGGSKHADLNTVPSLVTNSFVGTEEYLAPEVIEGVGHGVAVDFWTLGILIYEMLHGQTPFRGHNRDETFGRILTGSLRFPEREPPISRECKALLTALLHPDPKKRLGAEQGASEVKAHKWFKPINFALLRHQTPPIVPVLSGPLDTRHFRKYKETPQVRSVVFLHGIIVVHRWCSHPAAPPAIALGSPQDKICADHIAAVSPTLTASELHPSDPFHKFQPFDAPEKPKSKYADGRVSGVVPHRCPQQCRHRHHPLLPSPFGLPAEKPPPPAHPSSPANENKVCAPRQDQNLGISRRAPLCLCSGARVTDVAQHEVRPVQVRSHSPRQRRGCLQRLRHAPSDMTLGPAGDAGVGSLPVGVARSLGAAHRLYVRINYQNKMRKI